MKAMLGTKLSEIRTRVEDAMANSRSVPCPFGLIEYSIVEDLVNDKVYYAEVTRVRKGQGKLRIYHGEDLEVIHETDVALSPGALFGPTLQEIELWDEMIYNFIHRK